MTEVIPMTGYWGKDDVVTGLGAGAEDCLSKPFGREELGARIEAVLRRTGARFARHSLRSD